MEFLGLKDGKVNNLFMSTADALAFSSNHQLQSKTSFFFTLPFLHWHHGGAPLVGGTPAGLRYGGARACARVGFVFLGGAREKGRHFFMGRKE
jgi:hypothetical protein